MSRRTRNQANRRDEAMPLQFAVLASGSLGNSALVKAGGSGLLVDFGLGPKTLENRLAAVGSRWEEIRAVVLTHTHGDHVEPATLGRLAKYGIPLYCHESHRGRLAESPAFETLDAERLVRHYDARPFLTPNGLRVEPIELSHDGGPTFGFRIEGRAERRGRPASIGYLADTGIWTSAMADALSDVDLLGVEFNHDVDLQRDSGRSPHLIQRNLGNRGHLSNDQGAALIEAVLNRSRPGGPKQVVLLHLSRQCNRPEIALSTARSAIRGRGRRISVLVAEQGIPSPNLAVESRRVRRSVAVVSGELPF